MRSRRRCRRCSPRRRRGCCPRRRRRCSQRCWRGCSRRRCPGCERVDGRVGRGRFRQGGGRLRTADPLGRAVHPGLLADEWRPAGQRRTGWVRARLARLARIRAGPGRGLGWLLRRDRVSGVGRCRGKLADVAGRCRGKLRGCRPRRRCRWTGHGEARRRRVVTPCRREPSLGLGCRLRYRCIAAEEALRCPYMWMLRTQNSRPEPGQPGEVPPGLVPVAQLVGQRTQLTRDGEDHRVVLGVADLRPLQCLLENPAGRCQLAQLAVNAGEPAHRLHDVRVIRAEPDGRDVRHRLEEVARRCQLPLHTQGIGVPPGGAEVMGCGHSAMLPAAPARTPVGCRGGPGGTCAAPARRAGSRLGAVYRVAPCPSDRDSRCSRTRAPVEWTGRSEWRNGRRASLRC